MTGPMRCPRAPETSDVTAWRSGACAQRRPWEGTRPRAGDGTCPQDSSYPKREEVAQVDKQPTGEVAKRREQTLKGRQEA